MALAKPSVCLHVRIDPQQYEIIKELAGDRGLSQLVGKIITAYNGDGRIRVAVDDYEIRFAEVIARLTREAER